MKILIILKRWIGGVGGGVKNISKELRKLGHDVDIIAREEDLGLMNLKGSVLKLRKEIKKRMKEKNYDSIYTQDWSIAFPLIFPYPIFWKKHFCMFHGKPQGKPKKISYIIGKLLGRKMLVMTPELKRMFPKANLNYCGVSLEQFKPLKEKREYFGWIEKGTEIITKEKIEEISKKLKLPLLIAKGFTHEEMNSKFYSKCKIFLSLPPSCAGFQASWLEAMAAGVPIVIGNNNGAGEVQPFDKIPLGKENDADFIINCIKNAKKKDYIAWIKEHDFSWNRHAKRLIEIFRK